MLKTLTVSNFALIEQAGVDFAEGLNILTGETGAGKSILVDALNTILGSRASTEFIRSGSDFFKVEAVFDIDNNNELAEFLSEQNIVMDDNSLIISRLLNKQGKSSILVNGSHVTLGALRQIGALLVDMHGQHENQALLKPEAYLALLDAFDPKIKDISARYAAAYQSWTLLSSKLDGMRRDSRDRAQRLDMLKWQTDEIKAASLKTDEEESLEHEIRVLANAEKLIGSSGRSYALLNSDDKGGHSVLSALAEVKKEVENICRYDNALEAQLAVITDALYQLEEAAAELRDYTENLDFNPKKLAQLQERLDIIHRMKKKYGATVDEVINYYQKALAELAEIANYDDTLALLEKNRDEMEKQLSAVAVELGLARRASAAEMAGRIRGHLAQLGMPKAKLSINVMDAGRFLTTGNNEVVIEFSANLGEEPKPLQKIASGGELSRIALAIKAANASQGSIGTMVFDEVDTGVGGQTAQMVAEKITLVSRNKQVLCITHLPQIAVMADHHIYVEKIVEKDRTRTIVRTLSEKERCQEVATMIAGDNITDAALNNTREMLAAAEEKKRKMVI